MLSLFMDYAIMPVHFAVKFYRHCWLWKCTAPGYILLHKNYHTRDQSLRSSSQWRMQSWVLGGLLSSSSTCISFSSLPFFFSSNTSCFNGAFPAPRLDPPLVLLSYVVNAYDQGETISWLNACWNKMCNSVTNQPHAVPCKTKQEQIHPRRNQSRTNTCWMFTLRGHHSRGGLIR